jgi:hypothetical protein
MMQVVMLTVPENTAMVPALVAGTEAFAKNVQDETVALPSMMIAPPMDRGGTL